MVDKKKMGYSHKSFKTNTKSRLKTNKATQSNLIHKFNQRAWLKTYTDVNTQKSKEAKTEFEKDFFKLLNNSVYGKKRDNVRNHRDIKLITSNK